MIKLISMGALYPPRTLLAKLHEVGPRGFKYAPLLSSEGPVTKWVWGDWQWDSYDTGVCILARLGKFKDNQRKELKKVVKEWMLNESM